MKIACLLLVGFLPLPAAADLAGRVLAVPDGHSLTVLVNEREPVKVRLLGVHAPQSYQDFGGQSRSSLAALAMGRDVRIEGEKKDPQGRLVARVWVADGACRQASCPKGADVGLAQLTAGWVWQDEPLDKDLPAADRQRYAEAEFMAKVRRFGLWAGKGPKVIPAWQQHRLAE